MFNANDAVSAGVVEKLLSADVSDEWVESVVKTEFGPSINERDVLFVKWRILASLNEQAAGMVRMMEDDIIREFWTKEVAVHKTRIAEAKRALDVVRASQVNILPSWNNDMSAYFANGGS